MSRHMERLVVSCLTARRTSRVGCQRARCTIYGLHYSQRSFWNMMTCVLNSTACLGSRLEHQVRDLSPDVSLYGDGFSVRSYSRDDPRPLAAVQFFDNLRKRRSVSAVMT